VDDSAFKQTFLFPCPAAIYQTDSAGTKIDFRGHGLLYALVMPVSLLLTQRWQAWALFVVSGVYFGLTEGVEKALVADLVGEEKRGTAYGFYNLAFSITVFPASLLFRFELDSFGARAAFFWSAAISVVAALLSFIN
jgi:sugar phosphate permease